MYSNTSYINTRFSPITESSEIASLSNPPQLGISYTGLYSGLYGTNSSQMYYGTLPSPRLAGLCMEELDLDLKKEKLNQRSLSETTIGQVNAKVMITENQREENVVTVPDVAEDEPVEDAKEAEKCCKICFDKKIKTVIIPCGHACLCISCARNLGLGKKLSDKTLCPICRNPFTMINKLFI